MSLSQNIVIYGACFLVGYTLAPGQKLKWVIPQFFWMMFVSLCVSYSTHTLFKSQWYKGVQEAVGFTLGF